MSVVVLLIFIAVYVLALWLGLYLIGRDPRSPRLLLTGLGLLAYALAVAGNLLTVLAPTESTPAVELFTRTLLTLPALFWTGALIHLLPEGSSLRNSLALMWKVAALPMVTGLVLMGSFSGANQWSGTFSSAVGLVVLLPMLMLGILVYRVLRKRRRRRVFGALVIFTLFFFLSTALILLPNGWLSRGWILLSIGTDVIILGFAIAYFDAFEEGEALVPDLLRSLDAALLAAFAFGGPVGVAIWLSTGPTLPMLSLLLVTVATAVTVSTVADRISVVLDRVALRRFPGLRQTRSELRTTARSLQRRDPALDPMALDEDEFVRVTRRALSNFGDLPRLSASPLINLDLVHRRLDSRTEPDNPLERAAELKTVLAESIGRLKPRNGANFGVSDEWRYYNALYFPYVVGIKPYSSRARNYHKDPTVREALEWFRTSVPERTLYNWQNAAAKLVARDLISRNESSSK